MKSKIILTVGMSCSGKTMWAEGFTRNRDDWINLNRDDVRFSMFTNGKRDWTRYKFNNKNEKRVTEFIDEIATGVASVNQNIIISDTNLNPKTRNKWKAFADTFGYNYEEKVFTVDWETARKRNQQREGGVSESILWSQYLRMNKYLERPVYVPDETLPKAVLVDLDGTIASMKGIRKPYEWDKVGEDEPRKVVIAAVQGILDNLNVEPIFLSGRDGVCAEETYNWIKKYVMDDIDFRLYMREQNDSRKDKIVKEELFWQYINGKFNVVAAIDDRASILQLWRELNIPNIIDVSGDRYYEF